MKNLINIIKTSYSFLNNSVRIIENKKDSIFLHNKKMLNFSKKMSENTFEGKKNCGACCYMLWYYLNKNNIKTSLIKSSFGHGRNIEDHCFLLYDDYIIDPTYRQMFTINHGNCNDKYWEFLFNNNSFCFVGKYKHILDFSDKTNKIYKETYKKEFKNDNILFWKYGKDYNSILDFELLLDRKYAEKKGNNFLKLNKFLIESEKKILI